MNASPCPSDYPCQACGACCAHFRVSFYWAEAEVRGLDPALTENLNPWLACMVGTNARAPHCVALDGVVGTAVACRIYEQRPTPCRELVAGDTQCIKARAHYGLPPLDGALPPIPH